MFENRISYKVLFLKFINKQLCLLNVYKLLHLGIAF